MTHRTYVALAACGALSWLLTGLIRRYAIANALLDIPNARSSHSVPVPRGGGVAIVVVLLAGVTVFGAARSISATFAIAFLGGGVAIATVGWLDDRLSISTSIRFAIHVASAIWAVCWLNGFPQLTIGSRMLPLGWIGYPLAVIGIVWMINLYNFMDGIDGLAAGQAVSASFFGGVLALMSGNTEIALISLLIAVASAGFLAWNWMPAKIFMGDVGSGFLGYTFAIVAIASENQHATPLLSWAVLLGVFIIDATTTLIRRQKRGEPVYMAHRSHAYQRLVISGRSHAWVTSAILATTVFLGLSALAMARWPSYLVGIALLALSIVKLLYWVVEHSKPLGSPNSST